MRSAVLFASLAAVVGGLTLAGVAQAENPQIAALQVALRSKGLYHGPIDGIQGHRTRAALRIFQRRVGLLPDGLAGRRTRAALGRLGGPLYGTRVLRPKMAGWDVAVLQFLLVRRGFRLGRLDGRFGRRTEAALIRFQHSAKLRPDGIEGEKTAMALCSRAVCAFRVHSHRRFTSYRVQPGDSLSAIAARYRLPLATIARVNNLDPKRFLLAGATLRIPFTAMCHGAKTAVRGSRGSVRALLDYWAGRYGVDRHLVRALAWMESGYQQDVTSPAGARGVMQVTPAAWAFVENVLLGRRISHGVEGNIRVGVALLHHLLREHGFDRTHALAAYVQGDRSVSTYGLLPATKIYVEDVTALAQRL